MLRLPTVINFPLMLWKGKIQKRTDDEETRYLLEAEETLIKHHSSGQNLFVQDDINKSTFLNNQVRDELVAILKFAIPLIVTFLLGVGNRVIDVWFLGKVGSEAMAVVSLGGLFTTVAGLSVGQGILTAIDTLVAQAFTGASNPLTVGTILQRGLLIVYIFGILIALLWTYAENILLYMGQTPELASMAQTYITIVTPNIFLSFTIVAIRKFLQGLGEMRVTMYLIIILFPINILSDYYFLIYLDLGYIGAAYQNVFFCTMLLLTYILFIFVYTDAKKYWPGFTDQAFTQWGVFLKLGIPGMLSVSTDWAFEVCAIIAGVLGQTSLAAQSVVLTVNMLLLMIPTAITTALIVRLGHHLGANQPQKTKLCVMISTFLGLIFVLVDAIVMYTYRSKIAHTFSTDQEVILAIEDLMGVGSLSHFALGFGIVLSGTLNAFGKQSIVAAFNIVSYYAIGLPFGLYMTYHHGWGLIGIWSGVVLSGVLKSIGETAYIICCIDWEQECVNAANRINKQEIRV
ncbi:mate-domain-containing protein [Helicostylum pulchrum]|nr:mate-domain-containing protein [Helicostylum pulchrum]